MDENLVQRSCVPVVEIQLIDRINLDGDNKVRWDWRHLMRKPNEDKAKISEANLRTFAYLVRIIILNEIVIPRVKLSCTYNLSV